MAASATDKFKKTGLGTLTTLESPGKALAASSINIGAATNYPTDTGVVFAIRQVDTDGNEVAGTYTTWKGTVSGTTISNLVLASGTDQVYPSGSTTQVYLPVSAIRENELIDGILAQHAQDGTHTAITGTSATLTGAITAATAVIGGTTHANAIAGWRSGSGTWTYASATTFTAPAADVAAMAVGTKINLTQTTVKYFYVTGISGTTVTVTGGSDYSLANAAITSPLFSNAASPAGFPQFFNYTPVWTATSSNPAIGNGTITGRFVMTGKAVRFRAKVTAGSTTTLGSGGYYLSVPVTAGSGVGNGSPVGIALLVDQGTATWFHVAVLADTTKYSLQFGNDASNPSKYNGSWTNTAPFAVGSTDVAEVQGYYEAA